jgi:hypothetical protein
MSERYNPPGNEPQEPTLAHVGQQMLEDDALQYSRLHQRLLDQYVVSGIPESEVSLTDLPFSPYNFEFASVVALKSLGYQVTLYSRTDFLGKNITVSCAPDDIGTIEALPNFSYLPLDLFEESIFIASICNGTFLASDLDHTSFNFHFKHMMSGKTEEEKDARVKRAFITALAIWQDIQDSNIFIYGIEKRHDELNTEANYHNYALFRKQGFAPYNIEQLYGMVEGNVVRRIAAMGEHAQPPAHPSAPKVYR